MADQKRQHDDNQIYFKKLVGRLESFENAWEQVLNPSDTSEKHKDDLVEEMKKMQVLDAETIKDQNEKLLKKEIKEIQSFIEEMKKWKSKSNEGM